MEGWTVGQDRSCRDDAVTGVNISRPVEKVGLSTRKSQQKLWGISGGTLSIPGANSEASFELNDQREGREGTAKDVDGIGAEALVEEGGID